MSFDDKGLIRFHQSLDEIERRRATARINGIPALHRLLHVALGDTGQAQIVARFLLAIHNGYEFPLCLHELRGLDAEIWDDCIAVLALDYFAERDMADLFPDAPAILDELFTRYGGQ